MFRSFKIKRIFLFVALLLATFLFTSGMLKAQSIEKAYKNLKIFSEVVSLIESSYVKEVKPNVIIEKAIQGMLKNLDAHSSYLPPDSYKEMKVETEGEFGGLGIEITIKNNILTVVSPIEDTPADRIGIQSEDMIIKIDNKPTRDMSLIDAVKKLRGPVNTDVTITILRKDLRTPKDFTITRAIIMIKSVWSRLMEDNIGYIRLRNFSKTTSNEVRSALNKLSSQKKKKLKGLVLDLRNNPGGLLNQAVEVADIFIKKGQLIVYTEGRTSDQNMRFKSRKNGKNVDLPLVILVNGGSASASEIVAGALKDLKRCIVMGTKTFGKGSVQTIIPLSNGSALRLTTAQYFTPSGKVIHEKGIMPDIVLENPKIVLTEEEENDEKDPSVHKFDQKEVSGQDQKTKQKESVNISPKDDKEARFLKVYKKDLQLQRAIELLRGVDLFQGILQKKAS